MTHCRSVAHRDCAGAAAVVGTARLSLSRHACCHACMVVTVTASPSTPCTARLLGVPALQQHPVPPDGGPWLGEPGLAGCRALGSPEVGSLRWGRVPAAGEGGGPGALAGGQVHAAPPAARPAHHAQHVPGRQQHRAALRAPHRPPDPQRLCCRHEAGLVRVPTPAVQGPCSPRLPASASAHPWGCASV